MSKQNQERSAGSKVLDAILSLALIAGVGYGCFYVASHGVKIDQTTTYYHADAEEPGPPEPDPNARIYEAVSVDNAQVHNGALILVNADNACVPDESTLVSLLEKKREAESSSFSVRDGDLLVNADFADAIISMMDAFYDATDDDNLLINSGYRTQETQQSLYDSADTDEDGNVNESMAGYSEHQTGLGIDLSVYNDEYDGTGIYSWIDEHCAEYGIILRYPEAKQDVTKVSYDPWHYRYVGKPHAAFIMQNHMCLEEYIELIVNNHPYEGEHLMVPDIDGKIYEVYYYAMDADYENTMVAVPAGVEYTISGTNMGGFIVTAETEAAINPEELPTAGPDDGSMEEPEAPESIPMPEGFDDVGGEEFNGEEN